MISTAEMSSLLATLYAAPLEPQKWQSFIDRLCTLTDCVAGYMLSSNSVEGNAVLAGGGKNFDPEVIRLYNAYYGATDPYQTPFLARPRVGLIHGEELVSHGKLLRTELFNDVLSRYDLEFLSLICFHLKDGEIDLLPMWRGSRQGQIDPTGTHVLESLIPHLRTALLLRKRLVASDAALIFSETILDAMSIGAFLVNGKGQIRHINRLASTHLEKGGCLRLDKGRLTTNDPEAPCGRLKQLIAQAVSMELPTFDYAPGGSLRLSHFNITVVPAPEQNQIGGHELYALVFVTDTRQPVRSRSGVMRQLYGLTPSEARVADGLLACFEVREIADRLGITFETCRFHLKRVFAKTGTRRQAELIRLMLSLPGQ